MHVGRATEKTCQESLTNNKERFVICIDDAFGISALGLRGLSVGG